MTKKSQGKMWPRYPVHARRSNGSRQRLALCAVAEVEPPPPAHSTPLLAIDALEMQPARATGDCVHGTFCKETLLPATSRHVGVSDFPPMPHALEGLPIPRGVPMYEVRTQYPSRIVVMVMLRAVIFLHFPCDQRHYPHPLSQQPGGLICRLSLLLRDQHQGKCFPLMYLVSWPLAGPTPVFPPAGA